VRAVLLALLLLPALAAGFAPVEQGARLDFPRDHGAHPDHRTEWWYVTGWLDTAEGRSLGFQITFFRVRPRADDANPSRFAPGQILFAHAAVADPGRGRLLHDERIARAGFGLAEAALTHTDVRIDRWSLRQDPAGGAYAARIEAERFALDLDLRTTQPPLLHGRAGFSQKAPDPRHASHYYSQPQLAVAGAVTIEGRTTRVQGKAWLDHEWSSEIMPAEAAGWDWAGINLEDGSALMAFRMRDRKGGALWAGGTLREPGGGVRTFGPGEVSFEPLRRWRSARTGAEYPVQMRLRVGDRTFELKPLLDDQELDSRRTSGTTYWEGAVRAIEAGRQAGRGYLELTGYRERLRF
jgi:predicted secreted hydrolase